MLKQFSQNDWTGGLMDSAFSGAKGSVIEAVAVDIFDEPNAVKLSRKLTLETDASAPNEVCNFAKMVAGSAISGYNCSYWFSSTSGNIWKRLSNGTWSLVHTIADCGEINGAGVWHKNNGDEYVFYSWYDSADGFDYLGYHAVAGLDNWSDAVDKFKSIGAGFLSSIYHVMETQNSVLVIGNENQIATVMDVGGVITFTASGTPTNTTTMTKFDRNYVVTALSKFGDDILIGASRDGLNIARDVPDYNYALLARWDTASDGFVSIKEVQDNGIYNIQVSDFGVYIFTGTAGTIMTYDGTNLTIVKTIKKALGSEDESNVGYLMSPQSACSLGRYTLFALSENSLYDEGWNEGVYCLGRRTSSYPLALTLQYPEPPIATQGTELITNGTFTGSAAGWSVYDDSDLSNLGALPVGGWSYGTNNVVHNGSGSYAKDLGQSITLVPGQTYQVTVTVGGSTGSVYIALNDNGYGPFSAGSVNQVMVAGPQWSATITNLFLIQPSASFDGTIDSVSVKELTYSYNLTEMNFGAMVSVGDQFLVSYTDDTASVTGVAALETDKRYPNGWMTLNLPGDQERSKTFEWFALTYRKNTYTASVISNLSLKDYYLNYDYSGTTSFVANQEDTTVNKLYIPNKIRATSIQPRIYLNNPDITTDDTPVVTNFFAQWNEEEKL